MALNSYLHMTSQIFEAGINPVHFKINTTHPELCGNPTWLEIVELKSCLKPVGILVTLSRTPRRISAH